MRGAYTDCKFCHGRGCLACPGEEAKDAALAPKLLATFDLHEEADMAALQACFSPQEIERNFRRSDGSVDQEGGTAKTLDKLRRIRPSVMEKDS